jgi:hypothetical protein
MSDYEREYDWGGYEVTKTKAGWVVTGWTSIQGELTNWRRLVKPGMGVTHDMDLEADWNDLFTVGEIIAERAIDLPDKVLTKGWLVE